MPITTIVEKTKEIIHPWPNTYTFTKSLAERALQIHRGNIPLLILRPAIIIAANSEPYPGWVDAMTAASPLTLMFSMGLMNYVGGSKKVRSDLIPVDFVSNGIIICTANQARKDCLSIVHSASSHLNPQTWYSYMMTVLHYSKTHPFENTIKTPKLTLVTKKQQ